MSTEPKPLERLTKLEASLARSRWVNVGLAVGLVVVAGWAWWLDRRHRLEIRQHVMTREFAVIDSQDRIRIAAEPRKDPDGFALTLLDGEGFNRIHLQTSDNPKDTQMIAVAESDGKPSLVLVRSEREPRFGGLMLSTPSHDAQVALSAGKDTFEGPRLTLMRSDLSVRTLNDMMDSLFPQSLLGGVEIPEGKGLGLSPGDPPIQ